MSRDIDYTALRGVWSWDSCTGIHGICGSVSKATGDTAKIG